MIINLKNKKALVTGGGTGLGQSIVKSLADAGADVAFTSRHNKSLKESPKFKRRKKRACPLTIDQINVIDPHDISFLQRFISDRGKILPRRNTGVSAKKQRLLSKAIKRARNLGLLSFCSE